MQRVLIGVCTYKRPRMLARCLESLAAQNVSPDIQPIIAVVDNEPGAPREEDVKAFALTCPFRVRYINNPRRGIAQARNSVLRAALMEQADWIASLDDDEFAEPDWLSEMMSDEYRDTPILAGTVERQAPNETPFWHVKGKGGRHKEGRLLTTTTTANVRFSAELPRQGIFFNETLALTGGEDNDYFARANRAGFAIRYTQRAVVTAVVHPERLTYRSQVYRQYWSACSDIRRVAIEKGWTYTLLAKGPTIPLRLLGGALELITSPLCCAVGLEMFKRRALHGGKMIAKSVGRIAGICGLLPEPYRVTVGN